MAGFHIAFMILAVIGFYASVKIFPRFYGR